MTHQQALAALDEEWRELAVLRLPGWADREPALAGASDLGSVLGVVRQRPDAALGALLRLGATGEAWAYRAVLQTMLGKVVLLCARRPDLLPEAISELWLAIVDYPLDRRPTSIAANLAWAVHRRLPRPGPWRPWGDLDPPAPAPGGPDAASTLAEARRLGLIDARTHRTLWTVYVAGRSSAEAAAELETTPELVRWRCSRALRRLANHSDLLSA